jgi:SSS family solute:Na+ symporter
MWIANLYYWGTNQYIIQRALAAKNLSQARNGLLFAAFLSMIVAVIIVLPGVIASELYDGMIVSRDEAFPVLIRELLPAGYSGLVIAALIAAIISSLNSMCNSVATIFTMDIYRHSINKKASQTQLVLVGRIVTAMALLLAVIVTPAVASLGRLFAFIQEYSGFVTPGVFCIFLLGLFWKRMSATAALWVVLLTIPVSTALKVFLPSLAFLDRMTVTFFVLVFVAIVLSHREQFYYKSDNGDRVATDSSSIVFNVGAVLIISMIAVFYIVFW